MVFWWFFADVSGLDYEERPTCSLRYTNLFKPRMQRVRPQVPILAIERQKAFKKWYEHANPLEIKDVSDIGMRLKFEF